MGGEAYALALWAGAELIDMEFVQFFPIGHLAPRLVGMDPIMWDPFRYKLGGKLLNGKFEEFIDRYGSTDFGKYNATRDVAAYAISERSRSRPRHAAWRRLSRLPPIAEPQLRGAFGPVIDRLLANGIDLTKTPVEVGPMAHYHMGGIRVDAEHADADRRALCRRRSGRRRQRRESFVGQRDYRSVCFRRARGIERRRGIGQTDAIRIGMIRLADEALERLQDRFAAIPNRDGSRRRSRCKPNCKNSCGRKPGRSAPARNCQRRWRASSEMRKQIAELHLAAAQPVSISILQDGSNCARCWRPPRRSLRSALARTESRGAHQREDFPAPDDAFLKNQVLELNRRRNPNHAGLPPVRLLGAHRRWLNERTRTATLHVRRGAPGEAARYDDFEVPYEEGMSVLDALRWIRAHLDSSLAIRYSCINANACKTCMALVNGEVEYTCIAKLTPGVDHRRAAAQAAADSRSGDGRDPGGRKIRTVEWR